MFKRVLIVEDMDDINKGVRTELEGLGINDIDQAQYCDDAFLKVRKAIKDKKPYELLISDLSFKKDNRTQKYSSGEALIEAIKNKQPEIKIIAYSIEDRFQRIRTLINKFGVNAYVCKGRRGLKDLTYAINEVYHNKQFLSPQIANALRKKTSFEIEEYHIELLKQLSNGLSQEEIRSYFNKNNIAPSSLSSIEKHLNKLKIQFKANNTTHLVAIVKDLGLI
ncbi:response regulator [Flavobacteriaceae bacterium F08102]|nr:response regulator [Flavobacteriaceae bacterium F08102]